LDLPRFRAGASGRIYGRAATGKRPMRRDQYLLKDPNP
jgi:hypothetical protein